MLVLAHPSKGLRAEQRGRHGAEGPVGLGRASAMRVSPPRGASSSSVGEHVRNRELGARLFWRRGIVPLNYPLTPLTLGGAEGPYKSQLLLLPLLLLLLFFFFFK